MKLNIKFNFKKRSFSFLVNDRFYFKSLIKIINKIKNM